MHIAKIRSASQFAARHSQQPAAAAHQAADQILYRQPCLPPRPNKPKPTMQRLCQIVERVSGKPCGVIPRPPRLACTLWPTLNATYFEPASKALVTLWQPRPGKLAFVDGPMSLVVGLRRLPPHGSPTSDAPCATAHVKTSIDSEPRRRTRRAIGASGSIQARRWRPSAD